LLVEKENYLPDDSRSRDSLESFPFSFLEIKRWSLDQNKMPQSCGSSVNALRSQFFETYKK